MKHDTGNISETDKRQASAAGSAAEARPQNIPVSGLPPTGLEATAGRPVLFEEPFLLLTHDTVNQLLHAQWRGSLTLDTVRAGSEQVLEVVQTGQYRRLLNDNTAVVSLDLTEEEQRSYQIMDRLFEAGLHYLAWVYAPVHQGRSYAENSIAVTRWPLILTFEEYAPALEWLRQAP